MVQWPQGIPQKRPQQICMVSNIAHQHGRMTKLIKVFTSYLNNDKMVFRYATMGITSKIEEIGDGLDTIGIGTERNVSK